MEFISNTSAQEFTSFEEQPLRLKYVKASLVQLLEYFELLPHICLFLGALAPVK